MVLIPVSYTHLTRLREQAFLNAGANIILTDKRTDDYKTVTMCYEGGIKSYVEFLNKERGSEVINNDVIYLSAVSGDSTAEVAMQYNLDYSNLIMSFANNIHTVDGGTHENRFLLIPKQEKQLKMLLMLLRCAVNSSGRKSYW